MGNYKLTDNKFADLCKTLGYKFKNRQCLELALSHCSLGKDNNERLEFLGDAVLSSIISHILIDNFSKATEGELSRLRAKLVCGEHLAVLAKELQLSLYIQLGDGENNTGNYTNTSVLADAFEAIIAALYLEVGYTNCQQHIKRWFQKDLDSLTLQDGAKDPKTTLQEYMQSKGLALPEYIIIEVSGKPHKQIFTVSCNIHSLDKNFTGTSTSRRRAEQASAAKALNKLEIDIKSPGNIKKYYEEIKL